MRIAIADYGVGNLHSISKALEKSGAKVRIVTEPGALMSAESIVFPGVGAFGAATDWLKPVVAELGDAISAGTPALGICIGMQVMFERSEESHGQGLSVFRGDVRKLRSGRIPHMGWNDVSPLSDSLFEGVPTGSKFYFANSYVCTPLEEVGIAETRYGETFVSAVRRSAVCGVQFHPEKSGSPGLKVLSNFVKIAEDSA